MPSLRDPLFRTTDVTAADLDTLRASGMSNLRRGFESGSIGNDITGMAADEASLRASGDVAAADGLRRQIGALQQRQAAYAPDVQDVTKVGGVGDALSWAGGAVGQGVASMMDPIAASTALTGAGTVVGLAPHPLAKLAGAGLRYVAAPLAAYGINARHLKGEVYNDMVADPTIMANHTAEQLNTKANLYGAGAALLDTAVPGMIGHQLGGGALRKGLLKSGGARLGAELLGEGTTEALQGYGSAELRTQLNPNRDASGDMNDRINDFAGGLVGAGPFAVAGHVADSGFRRAGHTGEVISEKAGGVVDLLDQKGVTGAVKEGATKAAGFAKGLFNRGKDTVIDLAGDEDGKITVDSVKDAFRGTTDGMRKQDGLSAEEQRIIRAEPPAGLTPEHPGFDAWAVNSRQEQIDTLYPHLERMAEEGDQTADDLLNQLDSAPEAARNSLLDTAAEHVLRNNALEKELSNAEAFGKLAGMAGKKAGSAAAQAGKGVLAFSKSVWDGMKEGARKNAQSWTNDQYEEEMDARKTTGDNFLKRTAAKKASFDRAQLMGEYLAAKAKDAIPAHKKPLISEDNVKDYMRTAGYEIADLADSWDLGGGSFHQLPQGGKQPSGPASLLSNTGDKRNQQMNGMVLNLNRLANNLVTLYGKDKVNEIVDELHSMMPSEKASPFFDYLRNEVNAVAGKDGRKRTAEVRSAAADAVINSIPAAHEAKLLAEGINLRTPENRDQLLQHLEKVATGRAPAELRSTLNKIIGPKAVNEAVAMLNAHLDGAEQEQEQQIDDRMDSGEAFDGYTLNDDGDVVEDVSDFEKGQGERKVEKGNAPRLYGFHSEKNVRTETRTRNPFAGMRRVSKEDMQAWRLSNSERRNEGAELMPDPRGVPNLFKTGQKLSEAMGGGDAIQHKINTLSNQFGVAQTADNAIRILREERNIKGANALAALQEQAKAGDTEAQKRIEAGLETFFLDRAGHWDFHAKSAHDVMEEMKMQPGRRLALFREYLLKDGKTNQARQVSNALLDMIEMKKEADAGAAPRGRQFRTNSNERKRIMAAMTAYFKDHHLVVGEQYSDRDAMKMTEPELLDMSRAADKIMSKVDQLRRQDSLAAANRHLDTANILTFQSELSPHKDKLLHITAGALVHWVKSQQGLLSKESIEAQKDYSNKNQNREYLDALMEGISILASQGFVGVRDKNGVIQGALPYKVNANGGREYFQDGIAPSLLLPTTTYEGMMYGEEQNKKPFRETDGRTEYSDAYVFSQANPDLSPEQVKDLMADLREQEGVKGYNKALSEATRTMVENAAVKEGMSRAETRRAKREAWVAYLKEKNAADDMVGKDQRRSNEPFTAEPLEQDDPGRTTRYSALTSTEKEHYFSLKTLPDRDAYIAKLKEQHGAEWAHDFDLYGVHGAEVADRSQSSSRVRHRKETKDEYGFVTGTISGEGYIANRSGREIASAKTDKTDKTPLDFFPKQKPNEQRDDFADVLGRTKESGHSVYDMDVQSLGKERSVDSAVRAPARAQAIAEALNSNYEQGVELIKSRLRTAARPGYSKDKNALLGGVHYAMPVAAALTQDQLGSMDMGPEQAKEMVELRRQTAALFAAKDVSPKMRTEAAKLLAPEQKVTGANALHILNQIANEGKEEATAVEPAKTPPPKQSTESSVPSKAKTLSEAIEERQDYITNPPADYSTDQVRKHVEWAERQIERVSQALKAAQEKYDAEIERRGNISYREMSAEDRATDHALSDEVDRLTDLRSDLRLLIKDAKESIHYDEEAQAADKRNGTNLFGKGEVAAAQVGKSRSRQGGADWSEGGRRLNAQDGEGNGMPANEAQIAEAKAYVQKVLGKQVRVEFEKIMGHSGEWIEAENLIRIATTSAAGALETAYHESLHAFFSKYVKNNPQVFAVLRTLAEDPKLLERVHALLDGFPAAQAQLNHGEERLAYMYQFWAAGKLDLPGGAPKTLFQKLRMLFKRILGMVTDQNRAVALFEALHGGRLSDPSAAGQVIAKELAKGTWTKSQLRAMDGLVQWVAGKTLPSEAILTRSVSERAQALARELYTNPADAKGADEEGYINAKGRHAKQYNNLFKEVVRDLSDRDLLEAGRHMMEQTDLDKIPYAPVRKAVMQTRQLNQRFYRYMTEERGMKIGNLGPKFYPRVWSKSLLMENGEDFKTMLKTHYMDVLQGGVKASGGALTVDGVAARILSSLLSAGEINGKRGPSRDDGILAPYFMSERVRDMAWLKPEHSAPFQEKNFIKTMTTYFHDGARAAEYTSRFGNKGELLEEALQQIQNELAEHASQRMDKGEFKNKAARDKWVERQMRDVKDAVSAMEGTIGKDIKPGWRKLNSWMVAYQNIRLLPLMLFSSMVDPLALIGRGAPMREAYDAYLRGMKEVFADWADMFRDQPKAREADKWQLLAEASGIVDAALFTTHVSDEYSSVYMDGKAKRMNDMLFKLNGMEAWDRGMRVAATKSAALFIARHKALPDTHSARWLSELGLKPEDIHLDEHGELITDKNELMNALGITKEDAERRADKMYYALSRWVQGAVLSPNAAHRPAWGSDPHYSMFFHLKQFTYSFHQTVLKRAVNELEFGNLAPLGTFAWYIPVMIASDITKGLIQGGGQLPSHMQGMTIADWIKHGGERAGVLGLGTLAVDAEHDLWSIAGPATEQIMDAFGAPARNTAINALPLHGLYAEALR